MEQKYSLSERNIQIIIEVLKANGIRKVVVSLGNTYFGFISNIQQDSFFEIYSCVDERSAAYLACGLAAESGEPVVLSCTEATASRNYYSGLTEAYYRKLPVLVITPHQGTNSIGHLIALNIDRRQLPKDIVKLSVDLPVIHDARDEHYIELEANKAVLELFRRGGGPVNINLHTRFDEEFIEKKLPACKIIHRHSIYDKLPLLPNGRIAIIIGSHRSFSEDQNKTIDAFCAEHSSVVFCDHTSGYYGKYRVQASLLFAQKMYETGFNNFSLLIHVGEISCDCTGNFINAKEIWRVSPDGEIRDTYNRLTHVFEMAEQSFFQFYIKGVTSKDHMELVNGLKKEVEKVRRALPELDYSNVWIAQQTASRIPSGSKVYLDSQNTLQIWNFFDFPLGVESFCNVGGCGIDGCISALVGASFVNPKRLYFGFFSDLAFFYDMNVVGNRHVGNNVRIMFINNIKGSKSSILVKHYTEDLGYEYLSAQDKKEFLKVKDRFLCSEMTDKPMVLELFTNNVVDNEMIKIVQSSLSVS